MCVCVCVCVCVLCVYKYFDIMVVNNLLTKGGIKALQTCCTQKLNIANMLYTQLHEYVIPKKNKK